ncbi:MAG: sigma-70 family RNA polymerase sigma factor [Proteobacteria bacterium]|nr:sigma-70 family RNA polymerase sigma factor [Pseudomonadota bacterium]
MNNHDDSDTQIILQVLNGDREAFGILVLKYQKKINHLVSHLVNDINLSSDITQETFIRAYRSLNKFRGDCSFYTWLYRIAVNTAKNHNKFESRRPRGCDIDILLDSGRESKFYLEDRNDPEEFMMQDEMQEAVVIAFDTLPEELRIPVLLREMEGLPYEKIAELMHCPVGTIRSRISRARIAIDEHLKPFLKR